MTADRDLADVQRMLALAQAVPRRWRSWRFRLSVWSAAWMARHWDRLDEHWRQAAGGAARDVIAHAAELAARRGDM